MSELASGDGSSFSLTVLGSDGSYPGPGGACSGYLLRSAGFATWMDAGPGTMANLQLHIPLASLDAVVVSHSHPDHWSDLEGLYVAMRYFLERRGLPIYAPEGLRDLMRGENRDGTLDWRVIEDGRQRRGRPGQVDMVPDRSPGGNAGSKGGSGWPGARLLSRHRPGLAAERTG